MRRILWLSVVALLASSCTTTDVPVRAFTLVKDAKIYTVNEDQPWAEAFAYDERGEILAVGSLSGVLDEMELDEGEFDEVLSMDGQLVLPGFQDPHVHVPEAGINENLCFLPPERSLADYVRMIKKCADSEPDEEWVRAAGASLFGLRDTAVSPIDALDAVFPDRPVLVLDDLGHAAWGNTAGLRRAGISQDSPDPPGGVLHRDVAGRLTGLLLEDAQQPLRNAAAQSAEAVDAGLRASLKELARNGVTTVSDAGGYWQQGHADGWERAADADDLTVRAVNSLYLYPPLDPDEQLAEFGRRFRNDPDQMLQINTAKVYIDGILDLGTAALLKPYDDPPEPSLPNGFNYFEKAALHDYVARLHGLGYRINFHVIGDAAVRAALDAIEAIPADPDEIAVRHHRLTHVYLVDPADLGRFEQLGVVADLQVGPESTALDYHDYLYDFIGERAYDLIPVDDLVAAGAQVTLSSDWDADPLSPLGIISRALNRESHYLTDVEEVVPLVTIRAAEALGTDESTGSIEVGKLADFVVLDGDIFDMAPPRIAKVKVVSTFVGGGRVF